jgi:hypothetical protein
MGSPGNAFEEIDQDFAGLKFALVDDVYDEQAFGSRYAHYRRGNQNLRLVWDGKEEWLLLENRNQNEKAWKELCIKRIGRETANAANIAALRAALQRQID